MGLFELDYDILEDMGYDLKLEDYFVFMSMNELVFELKYGATRRVEYYYATYDDDIPKNQYFNADIDIMSFVCIKGELDVVKWLHYNNKGNISPDTFCWVVFYGRLDIVEWLNECDL